MKHKTRNKGNIRKVQQDVDHQQYNIIKFIHFIIGWRSKSKDNGSQPTKNRSIKSVKLNATLQLCVFRFFHIFSYLHILSVVLYLSCFIGVSSADVSGQRVNMSHEEITCGHDWMYAKGENGSEKDYVKQFGCLVKSIFGYFTTANGLDHNGFTNGFTNITCNNYSYTNGTESNTKHYGYINLLWLLFLIPLIIIAVFVAWYRKRNYKKFDLKSDSSTAEGDSEVGRFVVISD